MDRNGSDKDLELENRLNISMKHNDKEAELASKGRKNNGFPCFFGSLGEFTEFC